MYFLSLSAILLAVMIPQIFAFGSKSSAKQVIDSVGRLDGKVAIVTGANSGIGLELTKCMAEAGCKVIASVRDVEAGTKCIKEAVSEGGAFDLVEVRKMDLASLKSVEAFASSIDVPEINYLVNNAGVMAVPTLEYTEDGFERQIGTNHYGHAHLTNLLYNKMVSQSAKSRIVTVASSAHAFGKMEMDDLHYKTSKRVYTPWGAYGQSKLANILFAKGLAMKLKEEGHANKVTSMSLHPGVIRTNLWRFTPINLSFFGALSSLVGFMDKTIPQGASTSAWACTSPRIDNEAPAFQGAYLADCGPSPTSNAQAEDAKLAKEFFEITTAQIAEAMKKETVTEALDT